MVAPSFVTVTSPMSSTIILSRPLGPKEDLTTFAIACVACTFWSLMSEPEIFCPPRKRVPPLFCGPPKMPDMIGCVFGFLVFSGMSASNHLGFV
jgi:hypothetical protein